MKKLILFSFLFITVLAARSNAGGNKNPPPPPILEPGPPPPPGSGNGQAAAPVQPSSPTCESAYTSGMESTTPSEVENAAEVCKHAVEAVCNHYVSSNTDIASENGQYLSLVCNLFQAYGENVGSSPNNVPTTKCKSGYDRSFGGSPKSVVTAAISDCNAGVDAECSHSGRHGNDRLAAAACRLKAAHGGFQKVGELH